MLISITLIMGAIVEGSEDNKEEIKASKKVEKKQKTEGKSSRL